MQAAAWRALHTLLMRKPDVRTADAPAALKPGCGVWTVDAQLRALQVGALVNCLQVNGAVHFEAGRVHHAAACAKEAFVTLRDGLTSAEREAYFVDGDPLSAAKALYDNYEYVRSKVNAQSVEFHMDLCAEPLALPELFVPLRAIYVAPPKTSEVNNGPTQ